MLTKELTSKTTSFAKGANYVGETWYGKKHGEGTMTWANGSKYAGQWNNGKKHGAGTMHFANGARIAQGDCNSGYRGSKIESLYTYIVRLKR